MEAGYPERFAMQALLLAGRVVVNVIPSTIPARVKPEFLFHSSVILS
jgi:hypothetical protein